MKCLLTTLEDAGVGELEALLAEGVTGARARERNAFDALSLGSAGDIVLCGAGGLGRRTLAGLRDYGIHPQAFADNNSTRWGSRVDGLVVLSPEDAVQRYGTSATFVSTVWGAFGRDRMSDRLGQFLRLGAQRVTSFVPLYWKYPKGLIPHYAFDLPSKVHEQADSVSAAYELWEDDASRREYLRQVRWRLSGDFDSLAEPVAHSTYFPTDLCPLLRDEVFVDCGAFDGDSIQLFLQESGGHFSRILAFEPDVRNFARLSEKIGSAPSITLRHAATGPNDGRVHLVADGTAASSIGETGEEVDCVTLDAALDGCSPTYLKMDIEGAELDALAGASRIIATESPVLAICCYHRQDHLWKIPLFIHSLNCGYRFYLRPHDRETFDLVCYAIPPHRARATPSTTSIR
jgi:FkbM family methyltransferase